MFRVDGWIAGMKLTNIRGAKGWRAERSGIQVLIHSSSHGSRLWASQTRADVSRVRSVKLIRWAYRFFLVLCLASPAMAQILHGTIAAVYFTKDKIVMAADSRGVLGLGKTPVPDNTECKIATPDGRMMFVSSGLSGYMPIDPRDMIRPWSNVQEIHRAYRNVIGRYGTPRGHVKEIANEWADLLLSHIRSLYDANAKAVVAAQEGGFLTSAILGGVDSAGRLALFRTHLALDVSDLSRPIGAKTDPIDYPIANFCFLGRFRSRSNSPR